jgi:hypothetical protein
MPDFLYYEARSQHIRTGLSEDTFVIQGSWWRRWQCPTKKHYPASLVAILAEAQPQHCQSRRSNLSSYYSCRPLSSSGDLSTWMKLLSNAAGQDQRPLKRS